jgi:flavin-dependent dehydrogenase
MDTDLLIVGAGPAGTSTALHLVREDPSWADRMVIIDRAVFPREKICGGGITYFGYQLIENLGLAEPQCFPAKTVRVHYRKRHFDFVGDPTVRVVAREIFDEWLLDHVLAAGVEVRQGVTLLDLAAGTSEVRALTSDGEIRARALVAADGALSRVRQALGWPDATPLGRTLEVITPVQPDSDPEYCSHTMRFDFSPATTHGLQGYTWDFPTALDGKPAVNRGVYDSRVVKRRRRADLKHVLAEALERRGFRLGDQTLKSAPIRWWDGAGRIAQSRVLLVGDAAGADPLFGEGIPFALGYGGAAAATLVRAFATGDFSFSDYAERALAHPIVRQIPTRTTIARIGYRFPNRLFLSSVWLVVGALVRNLGSAEVAWRLMDRANHAVKRVVGGSS